jgi:hypothetical protein
MDGIDSVQGLRRFLFVPYCGRFLDRDAFFMRILLLAMNGIDSDVE